MSANGVFNTLCILIVLSAILIICAAQGVFGAVRDGFVQAMEMQMQIHPGDRRVWPICQCSVKYVGTTVKGKRYFVEIDKLD